MLLVVYSKLIWRCVWWPWYLLVVYSLVITFNLTPPYSVLFFGLLLCKYNWGQDVLTPQCSISCCALIETFFSSSNLFRLFKIHYADTSSIAVIPFIQILCIPVILIFLEIELHRIIQYLLLELTYLKIE
jgi:hypothetical protein